MAIYISKNALSQNPLNEKVIDVNDQKEKALKSSILDLSYLQRIASNDLKAKPISVNNAGRFSNEIIRVKMALNIIDDYIDLPGQTFDIPGGALITDQVNSGNFDTHFINALNEFQSFAGLPVTTEIDSRTLSKIDLLVDPGVIYDRLKNRVVGRSAVSSINLSSNSDTQGNFQYQIEINGQTFDYSAPEKITVTPIIPNPSINIDDGFNINLQDDPDLKNRVFEQNNVDGPQLELLKDAEIGMMKPIEGLSLEAQPNEPITPNSLQNELDLAPPKIMPDKHARLYLVKPGDDLGQLLEDEYYNGQSLTMLDKYNETDMPIYTFPARTLNPDPGTRKDDARYQFYLNLIYYYNTPEGGENGDYNEYGIKKAPGYVRYQDDHLEAFNMFDNEFSPSNPESVLPNYYRFLKAQEQNGSSIQFDAAGKPTSFQLDPGKYMWIPSREFSEGLYYHMNFRHKEMLMSDISNYITEAQENQLISDMEDPSIWDIIAQAITDFVDYLKGEVLELFQEVLDYFRKIYAWIINYLAQNMYRGLGGNLSASLGVTWGYPIATDIITSKAIWRKMSPLDELTFVFREDFEAFVGLDTGIGGSVGFKFGGGKKRKGSDMKVGVGLAAGVQAGVRPKVSFEYEFPIRPEETGLLVMCITVFGGTLGKLGASLLGALNIINLDPRQYLTWSRMGMSVEASAWGIAQVGFATDGTPKEDKNVTKPATSEQLGNEEATKSFLNIENIWDKLPGAGFQANGRISLGKEIEYTAKYDDKPLVPEINGRVPSEVEIENMYFIHGQTMTGIVGNLLQRLLISFTTPIDAFLSMFNVDIGFGIGTKYKFTRTVDARQIQGTNVDLSGAIDSIAIANALNGNLRIDGTDGIWESQLFLSKFSGDVDGMFLGGSDIKLKLDAYKIRQAIFNSSDFFNFNTIDNVLQLIYSIEIHYLPNLLVKTKRKVLANSFFKQIGKVKDSATVKGVKRDFLETAYLKTFKGGEIGGDLDIYAGANIKMELKLQNFYTALKYFLRRWYIMLEKRIDGSAQALQEWEDIKKDIDNKEKEFQESNYSGQEEVANSVCYEDLYLQLEDLLKTKYNVIDNLNYRKVAIQCLFLPARLLKVLLVDFTLDPVKTTDNAVDFVEDFKLVQFVKALTTLAEFVDITAGIEAKLGVEIGFAAKAAFGAKARLALSLGAAIIYRNQFIEGTVPVVLPPSDPLFSFNKELNDITDVSPGNQNPDGIRQALNNISN